VLLGAQLGAAATPSVLGLASTREGLLVTAIGVLWLSLAIDRRGRAIGQVILGTGLLFYGLHTLRIGFEPLVSDPALLQHIEVFNADSAVGLGACALAGLVLAALLQSPGPVFVIVLSLAESTGRLELHSALAILCGTGLGAAVSAAVVAWPFGTEPRRLAQLNLLAASLGTLLLISTVHLWSFLADAMIAGSPAQVDLGKKVLLPKLGSHLVLAFILSQTAVTVIMAAALPMLAKLLRVGRTGQLPDRRIAEPASGQADALRAKLSRVLQTQRGALVGVFDLWLRDNHAQGVQSEHALSDARVELETAFSDASTIAANNATAALMQRAAAATLQLQRATEALLQQAEASLGRRLALSANRDALPWSDRDTINIRAMHALLLQGVDDAMQALTDHEPPDLDRARTREIQLNALELASRQVPLLNVDPHSNASTTALHLAAADLANAHEVVGNHLYRLCETLASEVDQDSALPAAI
jgi:Na+/phosphate symporter